MSIIDRIRGRPRDVQPEQKQVDLEESVMELVDSKHSSLTLEGKTTKEKISLYYKLYDNDDLTFKIVNYLAGRVSHTFMFIGDEPTVEKLNKWASTVNLGIRIEDIVRDIVIAGTAWAEMVLSFQDVVKGIDSIVVINPDSMDFIRDLKGNVVLDDNGVPKGYIQDVGEAKREWTEHAVIQDNRVIYAGKPNEDVRDRIRFFKLAGRGDSYLGKSFVASSYRSAIIRCNIADMIGEAAFRGGGLVAKYEGDMPADQKKKLRDDLKNITARNTMLIKSTIELGTMPIPDTENAGDLMYRLADVQATGMDVPLDILLTGGRNLARDLITKIADMETTIDGYHDRIAEQLNDQIIGPLLVMWNMKPDKAKIKFVSASPGAQLNRARVISTLARRNLMTYDPEMEVALRKELKLPYTILEKEVKDWIKNGRPEVTQPEVGKESNIIDTKDKQSIGKGKKITKSNKDTDKADEESDTKSSD